MSHVPLATRRAAMLAMTAGATVALMGQWPSARSQAPIRANDDWFRLGIASGTPTDSSVVLWTRLAPADTTQLHRALMGAEPAIPVQWELADDEWFTNNRRQGTAFASPDLGYSVHVNLTALAPDRWYFYRFRVGDLTSAVGRTRTLPAPGAAMGGCRIGVASCQNADQGHWAAWHHMQNEQLDAVVFLGDYIYEYPMLGRFGHARSLGWAYHLDSYRERYAIYKAHPALQAMHAQVPWLLTWDDHELHNDYAGIHAGLSGPPGVDFALRRAHAYQAYYENMPLPLASLTRGLQGLASGADLRHYRRITVGNLFNLFLLDGRQYKDAPPCTLTERRGKSRVEPSQCAAWNQAQRSMLGLQQEQWLAQQLGVAAKEGSANSSRPVWNLLAQGTLFGKRDNQVGEGERYFYEGWDGYDGARTRLLQALAQSRVSNPVMLGGDVHEHWAGYLKADYQRPNSATLGLEFTTTSISSRGNSQADNAGLLDENPHFVHNTPDRRGYTVLHLSPTRLSADLKALDDVTRPDANIYSAAKFRVQAGQKVLEVG